MPLSAIVPIAPTGREPKMPVGKTIEVPRYPLPVFNVAFRREGMTELEAEAEDS